MGTKNKESFYDIISNPLDFIFKRLPNVAEVITSSASQAVIDTLFGRFKTAFGDNPTASTVTRDVSKLPTVYANMYNNNTLGHTDVVYDIGAVYSHTSKTACKLSVILTLTTISEIETGNAGRSANYICEIPNRFLSIVSRERQREEKFLPKESQTTFLEYLMYKSKSSWWTEAAAEAMLKTTTSDQLGKVTENIGYIQWIRASAAMIDNMILVSCGAAPTFEDKDDIYAKMFKSAAAFGFNIYDPRIPFVAVTTAVVDLTAKFSTEVINTYILGTPTRTLQDFAGNVMREQIENYYNNVTLAGEIDKAEL